jgi:gluconolactonase
MSASCKYLRVLAGTGLLLFSASLLSQELGSPAKPLVTTNVVDETVPPPSDDYLLGPDSKKNPLVPQGGVFKIDLPDSKIFPGTRRTITVYVPTAYRGDKPACVYVGLDGLGFNAATVFDNLIAQHAMPVTIGIGISPGVVPSANAPENPRFDRSYEFDSRSDRLARFVLDEVLPEVEKYPSAGGVPIRISVDPNDRAIGGGSTGAIAAFTVAWEHPEAFRRVYSAIGTYVGMRGGEQYYVLVRKTEPKPLRIFMQDGVHDEWMGGPEMGDWWMSNQTMNRALEFAGYDVRHVWGLGTHNGNHADSLFPEVMRWLWRDYPAPIQTKLPGNPVLQAILQPGEDWKVAADACGAVLGLAANPQGQAFHSAPAGTGVAEIVEGAKPTPCVPRGGGSSAIAFGADGTVYTARAQGGIKASNQARLLRPGLNVRNLTVRSNGDMYAVARTLKGTDQLWLMRATGGSVLLEGELKGASSVALTPDGSWLFVAQSLSRAGMSYRVKSDGTLDAPAPFYDFYVPAWADESGAAAIAMDRDGRAYVATTTGVQVFDRNGRVAAILPLPGGVAAASLCFAGKDFATLYVGAEGKIYKRKLKAAGVPPFAAPLKLPPWGAG